MTSGRIIFLNGTSSSGKSSIARELLDILNDGVFFHMAVDGFNAMRSKRELGTDELDAALRRTRMGFHRSIAAMAEAGNDIVVDHVLSEPWRLLDCLTVLQPENVLFIGVHCPLDELTRRELARGDRPPGLAAHQYDLSTATATTTWNATPARRAHANARSGSRSSSRTAPAPPPSPASADATCRPTGSTTRAGPLTREHGRRRRGGDGRPWDGRGRASGPPAAAARRRRRPPGRRLHGRLGRAAPGVGAGVRRCVRVGPACPVGRRAGGSGGGVRAVRRGVQRRDRAGCRPGRAARGRARDDRRAGRGRVLALLAVVLERRGAVT